MAKKDKISIVVPCYNEEEALPLFYEEIIRFFLMRFQQKSPGKPAVGGIFPPAFHSVSVIYFRKLLIS